MSTLAHSQSSLLNPDRNHLLRYFLKKTFYAQFCAGENAQEVQRTITSLKGMGFKGVMLGYAKEVVLDEKASQELESSSDNSAVEECIQNEILPWREGTLKTIDMTEQGDFVALKYVPFYVSLIETTANTFRFTGAGTQALYNLSRTLDPSPALEEAITAICDLASSRGVRLLFDAEQQALQQGIDAWTLKYMRRYNNRTPGKAIVYNTYQSYLKSCPRILAQHLAIARKEGFTLGVKLVRGAYLGSDPRHLIHDTKADTDMHYDSIAESLMRKKYGAILRPAEGEEGKEWPGINLALAGHNITSVRCARTIRDEQASQGDERIDMVYGQLQGMADEVSCELVQAAKQDEAEVTAASTSTKAVEAKTERDIPQAYKYLVWGTTGECMKYLLRRAHENKDAVGRTRDGRNAMARELVRRVWG